MKLGIMQPYFLPYIGYFQLIKAVDKYVIYDDVNYIKGGWINRNNILVNKNKNLFTIMLKDASSNKLINEIEICDNFKKIKKTIEMNYKKAPFYDDVYLLLERIFSYDNKNLAKFIANSIVEISKYLNIDTEILISSEINKDNSLKAQDKVIDICKNLGANMYINAIGGQDLYNYDDFERNGITLNFIKTNEIKYKQFDNDFIPFLSIIDVLMFNSIEDVNKLLDDYELIGK